jgi:hypothetical protein
LKPTPKWGPALEINREKYFDDLYQMESTDKGLFTRKWSECKWKSTKIHPREGEKFK